MGEAVSYAATSGIHALHLEVMEILRPTLNAKSQAEWDKPMDQLYACIGQLHQEGIPGTREEFARYVLSILQPHLQDRVFYCTQRGFEVPSGLRNASMTLIRMLSSMVLMEAHPDATDAIQRYTRGETVSLVIDQKRKVE